MIERFNPIEKLVKDFYGNTQRVTDLRNAIDLLERSGVFNMLQRMGVPGIFNHGQDINMCASQASWSNGYATALDHIRYFEKIFKAEDAATQAAKVTEVDFGGKKDAIKKGYITEEDLKNE